MIGMICGPATSVIGMPVITLERTEDVELVRSIVGHPKIRAVLFEVAEPLVVPLHPSIHYLIAREERMADGAVEDKLVGLAAFHQVNSITWTPHLAILPEHRGKGSDVLRMATEWMFERTACRKLFAAPPAYNTAMIRCFEKSDFNLEGRSPRSFQWQGQLYDRVLMGKEKI